MFQFCFFWQNTDEGPIPKKVVHIAFIRFKNGVVHNETST